MKDLMATQATTCGKGDETFTLCDLMVLAEGWVWVGSGACPQVPVGSLAGGPQSMLRTIWADPLGPALVC